jgi:hypothetical protein
VAKRSHSVLSAAATEQAMLARDRPMDKLTFWKRLRETVSAYRSQLRFSLRMTAAGLLALIVAQSRAHATPRFSFTPGGGGVAKVLWLGD